MRPTRLTVSLDADTARELEELPSTLAELRERLPASLDPLPVQDRPKVIAELVRSLEELGTAPSSSAILRAALRHFVVVTKDLERAVRLEGGYRELAGDEERTRVIEAVARRTPKRRSREP